MNLTPQHKSADKQVLHDRQILEYMYSTHIQNTCNENTRLTVDSCMVRPLDTDINELHKKVTLLYLLMENELGF